MYTRNNGLFELGKYKKMHLGVKEKARNSHKNKATGYKIIKSLKNKINYVLLKNIGRR
jgi:hypothetical protein